MYQIKASLLTKLIKSCCVANHLIHLPYHKPLLSTRKISIAIKENLFVLLHSFDDDHIPVHIYINKFKIKNQKQRLKK